MLSLLLKCSYAAINDFGDNQRLMKPLDWALESLGAPHLNGFVMIGNTNNSPNRRLSMSNINKSDLEIKEIADETIGPEEEKDKINADNIGIYRTNPPPFLNPISFTSLPQYP